MDLCLDCFMVLLDRGELPKNASLKTGKEHGFHCQQCLRPICTQFLTTGKCFHCERTFYPEFFAANIAAVEWLPSNIHLTPTELYCWNCAVKELNVTRMYAAWQSKEIGEYAFYHRCDRRLHAAFCDECGTLLCDADCDECVDLVLALKYAKAEEERAIIAEEIRRVQTEVVFSTRLVDDDIYIVICNETGPCPKTWQTVLAMRGEDHAASMVQQLNKCAPSRIPFFALLEAVYYRMTYDYSVVLPWKKKGE